MDNNFLDEADRLVKDFCLAMYGRKPSRLRGNHTRIVGAALDTIALSVARASHEKRPGGSWAYDKVVRGHRVTLWIATNGEWGYHRRTSEDPVFVWRRRLDFQYTDTFGKSDVAQMRSILEELLAKSGKESPW